MIFKGRSRADGGKLAAYLLSPKNEQVRVWDLRGTVIDERSPQGLRAALGDMDELGQMTRAKSSLFHLAINPDDRDRLTPADWKASIEKAEKALGLEEQPRAVVSHTYGGKQHLHVVWSRVDVETRTCTHMSFSNLKLCQAAREIEIELGLQQTPARGEHGRKHKLKQHVKEIQQQQDERSKTPRAQLNATVTKAWHEAQTAQEFKAAIEDAGYLLALGDRSVSVMNAQLENYPVQRCIEGVRIRDVREKLGDLRNLPTVEALRRSKSEAASTVEVKTQPPRLQPASNMAQPTRQRAKDLTASEVPVRMTATNDNDPTQNFGLERAKWESEAQFQARVARAINGASQPPDQAVERAVQRDEPKLSR